MSAYRFGHHEAPKKIVAAFRAHGVELASTIDQDFAVYGPSYGVMVINGPYERCATSIPKNPTDDDIAAAARSLKSWLDERAAKAAH